MVKQDSEQSLAGLHVAYVVRGYPKVSHAFIQREVRAMRAAGANVDTYSVRRAEAGELLSPTDREEAALTTSLRPISPLALVVAHLRSLARWPRAYRDGLRRAVGAAPEGLRARLWQVFYFGQAVVLHDRLRRRRARHVHAHLANVATDVVWLAAEFGNVAGTGGWTWSFTMHGPTEFREVGRFNLARKVEAADLVVCISDFCRSQLMALVAADHWDKLVVVHCGVDVAAFAPAPRRQRVPQHLLSVGRLVPEKAQSVLLLALESLVERGHDLRLTIVGDGPDRARLVGMCSELGLESRVELPGAIGQDRLAARFHEADLFVMASFDEGVPVVLMEAMACGLPVVATHIAGIPELINDGRSGLLVPAGRADALAGAVERLLKDEQLRERLASDARRTVEESFDASGEAIRLGGMFERVALSSEARS